MKIAVNTRLLIENKLEGIGYFTYETLKRITRDHPEHQFLFLFDRPFPKEFLFHENVRGLVVEPPTRHPVLWYYWLEHALPKTLAEYQPDLFLSTDGYLSLKSPYPSVLVVHDLGFLHYPEHVPYLARKFYRTFVPRYVKKANYLATVSEASRQDLADQFGLDRDKIEVIYNAPKKEFQPIDEARQQAFREKYAGGSDYFLYVGPLQPRKNVARLFEAFDQFKKTENSTVKLLIAGSKGWSNRSIHQAYEQMQFREEVYFLDYLPLDELAAVMGAALALFYVSCFEGFGVPIVEAMQCDVPVVTSNVSSMPEVAGDAALLVDPFSVAAITGAMIKITDDPALRHQLIVKGRQQKTKFNWDDTARRLWACVERGM